jgi:hypothetical protein
MIIYMHDLQVFVSSKEYKFYRNQTGHLFAQLQLIICQIIYNQHFPQISVDTCHHCFQGSKLNVNPTL